MAHQDDSGKPVFDGKPMRRRKVKLNIPAGIEKTLYKASIDERFRQALLEDREGTLAEHGLRLTQMEQQILRTVADERLDFLIRQIRPEKHGKRRFMKTIATAVVSLAAGTAAVVTEGCDSAGIDPDPDVQVDSSPDAVGGIWPDADADMPDDTVTDTSVFDAGGIAPDVPDDEVEVDAEDASIGGIWPDAYEDVPDEDAVDADEEDVPGEG